jgi:UDP-3-O-[3-hydroxymyristoyl] glucosamine N-acyltransferase
VRLGEGVSLGNYVRLGEGVSLGNDVRLGEGVSLGNYVRLGNDVRLGKSPIQIQGTKHLLYQYDYNQLGIGCEIHMIEEWKKNYKEIGKQHGYTDEEIKEYKLYIDLAAKRMMKKE